MLHSTFTEHDVTHLYERFLPLSLLKYFVLHNLTTSSEYAAINVVSFCKAILLFPCILNTSAEYIKFFLGKESDIDWSRSIQRREEYMEEFNLLTERERQL
jgi:hypothetical protein